MSNPTKQQQAALEMARNGHGFCQLMAKARKETGVKDINTLAKAISEATGIERQYIVDCFKMYREFVELNSLKPGAAI